MEKDIYLVNILNMFRVSRKDTRLMYLNSLCLLNRSLRYLHNIRVLSLTLNSHWPAWLYLYCWLEYYSSSNCLINLFHATGLFLHPLKTSEILCFFLCFQGGTEKTSSVKWHKTINYQCSQHMKTSQLICFVN